jgi:chemosensory pili system protein ChpA (sensor histidine kinase/response regulator)
MRVILASFGVRRVEDAADTNQAMGHIAGGGIDIAFVDFKLAGLDGLDFCKRIRLDPRSPNRYLPIIMITSRTGQKHRDRAMAIGVNDYLGKPYQESVLLESIAYWSKSHA